jgi:UDP-N-acetylmuramate dehydrogenase
MGCQGSAFAYANCKITASTAQSGVVEALAGEPIPSLARRAARAGLHGLEWAVGNSQEQVGGAAVMNAGCSRRLHGRFSDFSSGDAQTRWTKL